MTCPEPGRPVGGRLVLVRSLITAAFVLSGCVQVLGLDDLVADRGGGAAAEGGGGEQGGGDGAGGLGGAASGGGGGGDGQCAGVCGSTPACGACPDVGMVDVGGLFTIDEHEVTNADYEAFLAVKPSLALAPMPACDWNDTYETGAVAQGPLTAEGLDDPTESCAAWKAGNSQPDRPVACVDWCDASAYCAWAGKRLCGKIGGGDYDVTDGPGPHADPAISEWFAACTGEAGDAFPYGPAYEAGRCNDENSRPQEVESYPGCEGGYVGLFDMSGNVAEWDDACTDFQSPTYQQNCLARGGSWYETAADLQCDRFRDTRRWNMSDGIGIRCCL